MHKGRLTDRPVGRDLSVGAGKWGVRTMGPDSGGSIGTRRSKFDLLIFLLVFYSATVHYQEFP